MPLGTGMMIVAGAGSAVAGATAGGLYMQHREQERLRLLLYNNPPNWILEHLKELEATMTVDEFKAMLTGLIPLIEALPTWTDPAYAKTFYLYTVPLPWFDGTTFDYTIYISVEFIQRLIDWIAGVKPDNPIHDQDGYHRHP